MAVIMGIWMLMKIVSKQSLAVNEYRYLGYHPPHLGLSEYHSVSLQRTSVFYSKAHGSPQARRYQEGMVQLPGCSQPQGRAGHSTSLGSTSLTLVARVDICRNTAANTSQFPA